ncbi:MAG: FHA domain-containing protein [Deltaproteobacteria bacterium]|nr:FHA domain-containing protein [Deltaproteobacteria bacterium]
MIRLHHVFGAQTGRVQEIDKPLVRCGRLPDNEVAFDPHADIDSSGRHAELRCEEGVWYVVDVGSRNGTMVNNQRVQRQRLQDGDVIEFGKGGPRLRVEIVGAPPVLGRAATELAAAHPSPTPPGQVVVHPQGAPGQPAASPPPSAPAQRAEETPGKATVAMMIASAVKGQGKSTAEIQAITAAAVNKSSRNLKIALAAVSVLFVVAVVGGVLAFLSQRSDVESQRTELRSAYARLEQLNQAGNATRAQDTAERAALQGRIQELSHQLEENARGPGTRIAQDNQRTVFMLAAVKPGRPEELGFCTGFAVRADMLATNAHCVLEMQRLQTEGAQFVALPNGGQGGRFQVVWMARHPNYRPDSPNPTEDCGLVRISGQTGQTVRLAPPEQLARLQPGDTIYVYGFPGNLMEARSPVATITAGVIGRITNFQGLGAPFATSLLLQHSAFTSPGTSGSPIFDNGGAVIGVNTGAFRRLSEQTVVDPSTGRRGNILMTQDLAGYAFGVRSDLVQSLLMGLEMSPGALGGFR